MYPSALSVEKAAAALHFACLVTVVALSLFLDLIDIKADLNREMISNGCPVYKDPLRTCTNLDRQVHIRCIE